ncbi:MAG: FG-GAP-like repeat-containing protein, partial [Myxococcota bacterium]
MRSSELGGMKGFGFAVRALETSTALGVCALTACFPSFPNDCIDNGCPDNLVCLASGMCVDPAGGGSSDGGVPMTDGGVVVVSVDPEANAVDGDPDAVEVSFSQPMREASARDFLLRSGFDGLLVSGVFGGASSRELTFAPSRPLRAGSRAEVTLRTTLQAVSGAPLEAPYVFRYRTATAPSEARYSALAQAPGRFTAVGALRVGDFDGDGTFEAFFTAGATLASILAADIDPSGTVTLRSEAIAANANALDFDAGDVNGDGRTDLVIASFEDQGTRVWFGEDAGLFRQGPVIAVGRALQRIRLGDLDGDGDLDFAAVIRDSAQGLGENVLFALGNGNGTFAISSPLDTLPGPGTAHDLRLADM